MKYLKIPLLILLILTFSTNARATETGRIQGRGKVSIIGHTGQDPVYKSVAGKHEFKEPKQNSKLVNSIVQNDFSQTLFEILLQGSESSGLSNSADSIGYSIPQFNSSIEYGGHLNHSSVIPLTLSNGVPAPPAFVLVLAGFAFSKRRRA